MKEGLEVSAPGKLMLFGEHAVIYGQPCIVTAVDQRMILVAVPVKEREFRIEAPDVGVIGYERDLDALGLVGDIPKGVRFVEVAIKLFKEKFGLPSGIAIKTKSEFETSGLGSSSAVVVCTIKALSELTGKRLSRKELFDLSYKTVLEVQKTGSGFDVAAAIWGGTVFYLLGGKRIEPLKVENLPLVVGDSGIKIETPMMIKMVEEKYQRNKKMMGEIFALMGEITQEARNSLKNGNFQKVGELADINQGLLEAISVSSDRLARLIFSAREAGAWGAKLSGAGGGDCVIAFVDEEKRKKTEEAIRKAGGKVVKVKTNAEGVRIE